MKNKSNSDKKVCRICKKVIVGESKLGLCPECINKYGSIAVTLVVGIAAVGLKGINQVIHTSK